MVNSPYYDNQHWEYHLPINPAILPGTDVDVQGNVYVYPWLITEVSIDNWDNPYFQPRLRDCVQLVSRTREARDDEAPELDD